MDNKNINLDIGSGLKTDWQPGDYIRIDPYAEGVDVKAFADNLPYENNSVDSIWSSHTLEHIDKFHIVSTLKEWYRILKPNGIITIRVPDLAWCCQWWLNHQTTGWDMDIIFGNQSREGEFHKTGFNREIMLEYLHQSGLVCKKYEELETHNQKTLSFECKPLK